MSWSNSLDGTTRNGKRFFFLSFWWPNDSQRHAPSPWWLHVMRAWWIAGHRPVSLISCVIQRRMTFRFKGQQHTNNGAIFFFCCCLFSSYVNCCVYAYRQHTLSRSWTSQPPDGWNSYRFLLIKWYWRRKTLSSRPCLLYFPPSICQFPSDISVFRPTSRSWYLSPNKRWWICIALVCSK